jgi:hypothetical protein
MKIIVDSNIVFSAMLDSKKIIFTHFFKKINTDFILVIFYL